MTNGESVSSSAAIRIWVTDDVHVAGVQVVVLDEEGNMLEKGEATQGRSDWWEYVPAAEGKVVVEARDLPGNVVKAEFY
jgi:hypothetical protein